MGTNRKGLGLVNPAKSIAPSPAIIEHYFVRQLHYFQQDRDNAKNFLRYVTYVRHLNQPEVPLFGELQGISCISRIVIDRFNGSIVNHWFELRDSKNAGNHQLKFKINMEYENVKINSFEQLAEFEDYCPPIIWLFKWHLNIVHMSREYLKGGWLERPARIQTIEKAKQARKYLNRYGLTDIINKAKPNELH